MEPVEGPTGLKVSAGSASLSVSVLASVWSGHSPWSWCISRVKQHFPPRQSDGRKSRCLISVAASQPLCLPGAQNFVLWWWRTLGAISFCLCSLYHFSCTVSSAPRTLLGSEYSVNTPNKRAFSRVGPGDDLTRHKTTKLQLFQLG